MTGVESVGWCRTSPARLRIHRSYIVAIDKIRKIDRNDCVYIGKEIIHVPDGYQQAFQKFLETHSFNK